MSLEDFAAIVSVVAVWLTTGRHWLCWPLGLVSVLMYAWVFYEAKLYSDALLQLIYVLLQLYGWWRWRAADMQGNWLPAVRQPARRSLAAGLALGALGALLLGGLMARFTVASLPWVDATLTAFSLVAQFWMARLYAVNWILWIIVDLAYVGMYGVKQLLPTAALYAGFVVLAAIGWRRWRRAAGTSLAPAPAGGG